MDFISVFRVVAIMCSGMMAGLLFGDWLGPSFARSAMSESSFIQFQQIVHLNYLRTLPALSTLALVAPVMWLIMLRNQRHGAEFKLLCAATVAIAIGFTTTLVFNVPVNDQLETWNAVAPPPNARELWNQWETAHIVRTIFWVAGFFLQTIAIGSSLSKSASSLNTKSATLSA